MSNEDQDNWIEPDFNVPDEVVAFACEPEEHLQQSVQALTAAVQELTAVMRAMSGAVILPRDR